MRRLVGFAVLLLILSYLFPFVLMRKKNDEPPVHQAPLAMASGRVVAVKIGQKTAVLPLEQYVAGAVSAELPEGFPPEAQKAQAVAVRSYALYQLSRGRAQAHPEADLCDSPAHCMAFSPVPSEEARQAAAQTAGQALYYEDKPALAVFFAAAAGKTRAAAQVWGGDTPYLTAVSSEGDAACPNYQFTQTMTENEVQERLSDALSLSGAAQSWFADAVYDEGGYLQSILVGGEEISGERLRGLLGLRSAAVQIGYQGGKFQFTTTGYGHGVGLSQYGAKAMAERGEDYRAILAHYYKDTQIKTIA